MTRNSTIPGGNQYLERAQRNGISRQLYRQRVVRDGMSPEEAADRPLRKSGRKPDPSSINQICRRLGVSRASYYAEVERRKKRGSSLDIENIILSLKRRRRTRCTNTSS